MGYSDTDWKAINTIRLLAVCLLPHHGVTFATTSAAICDSILTRPRCSGWRYSQCQLRPSRCPYGHGPSGPRPVQ